MEYKGIFDTHAHYDDEHFDNDRDAVLKNIFEHGVSLVVDPACDLASCEKTLALSEKYGSVYSAVGVHPEAAEAESKEGWLEAVAEFAKHKKVVAIGEIGLDYHYDEPSREIQKAVLEKQLGLSNDLGLPVIIHDREAHADVLELVKKYRPRGIIHCFSGSAETAAEFLRLGMYIGFTGSVTFKNASKLLLAAKAVPEERLLLETDCPYMAPVPYRGQRCDSTMIAATAERLAELRGTDAQRLIEAAAENGRAIYNI